MLSLSLSYLHHHLLSCHLHSCLFSQMTPALNRVMTVLFPRALLWTHAPRKKPVDACVYFCHPAALSRLAGKTTRGHLANSTRFRNYKLPHQSLCIIFSFVHGILFSYSSSRVAFKSLFFVAPQNLACSLVLLTKNNPPTPSLLCPVSTLSVQLFCEITSFFKNKSSIVFCLFCVVWE